MNELLEKVKRDYLQEKGYKFPDNMYLDDLDNHQLTDIAIRFAKVVAEKSLENAASNATILEKPVYKDDKTLAAISYEVNKESITDTKNIEI